MSEVMERCTHRFEAARLGKAPFRVVGMTEEKYVPAPGIPAMPGSTCDYCGQAIMNVFHIRSADGKGFKVGCDCVMKVDDYRLARQVNALKLEAQHKRDDSRITAAFAVLDAPGGKEAFKDFADQLGYIEYCRDFGGRKSKLKCARMIEARAAIAKATTP